MKRNVCLYGALGAVVVAVTFSLFYGARLDGQNEGALVTPPGVTLQPLGKAQGYDLGKSTASAIARDQIAYTNAQGLTLYTWDKDPPGKATCAGVCAEQFRPFLQDGDTKPIGDWSLIVRSDGRKQWALKGKALYTYSKDVDPGSLEGNSPANLGAQRKNGIGLIVGGGFRGELHGEKVTKSDFPVGWKAALLYPVEGLKLPVGVSVKEVPDAAAFAFVDYRGYTLYEFMGDGVGEAEKCALSSCAEWLAFKAPQLAESVGDFTVVDRRDGVRQWAYKNKLLYTYSGDLAPGYANGFAADKRWRVASVFRYYMPPEVSITRTPGQGSVLATAAGMTLYRRDGYILQSGGGHSLRRGQPPRPAVGRDIGTDPRCNGSCESVWHPFLAPAEARPWGFWNVATRRDGRRQWVYQGYALWTYDGDKKPGDMNGHDTYDIMVSDDPDELVDVGTPMDGGAGLWWSIALP